MKKIEKTYEDFTMWYKLYQFKRDGILLEKEEIVKMISYFERIEEYEHCDYLKKLIKG